MPIQHLLPECGLFTGTEQGIAAVEEAVQYLLLTLLPEIPDGAQTVFPLQQLPQRAEGPGPGAESQAHAPNEITWKQDLVTCAALYAAVPMNYHPENSTGDVTVYRAGKTDTKFAND